jgi:protein-tyrosine-phosphatase
MAEAIARHVALTREPLPDAIHVEAFSAGSEPQAAIAPLAISTLEAHGISTDGLRPKSLSLFQGQSFDYVVVLADRSREVAPVFPDKEALHWGYSDPSRERPERAPDAFKSLALGLLLRVRMLLDYHAQASGPPKSITELNTRLIHFAMAQTRTSIDRMLSSGPSRGRP